MNHNRPDILAPVGSYESLTTAIKAGCDSVYFGVEQLNMRARSSINFTTDDLARIADVCASHSIKAYLTLNTVLYDHDMALMRNIVGAAKEGGISAVIASDHAVMAYAKSIGLPVHVSTQANVSNIETVDFYSAYADLMITSRELSLGQVESIVTEIKRRQITGPSGNLVRIETFAHGALCMATSGKCYLSLHSNNSSANRGACIQNCRKKYVVIDQEDGVELEIDNEYIMSAKDLCTIGFLPKLVDAGINVFKIEGRGRNADYVHTTVSCYREAVSAIEDGTYGPEKIADWMERLATVFNRGFWDGYYLGQEMGEWNDSYGSQATERKILIGKGIKYFKKIGVAEFRMESNTLKTGDKILISGPTTGVVSSTVEEIRVEGETVDSVAKGSSFSVALPEIIRPSDKLYKVVER